MKIIHIMILQNNATKIVILVAKLYKILHKIVSVNVNQKLLFQIKNVHKVVNKDIITKMDAKKKHKIKMVKDMYKMVNLYIHNVLIITKCKMVIVCMQDLEINKYNQY